MTPVLSQWLTTCHREIGEELAQAKEAVPPLAGKVEQAIAVADSLAQTELELQRVIDSTFYRAAEQPLLQLLSPTLAKRVGLLRAELDESRRQVSAAKVALKNARDRVAELQRSLTQIDRMIPPADESQEAA